MGEWEAVRQSDLPRTRTSLAADFERLGLRPGMTVIVHSSLRSLGWVCGGPVAVIQALLDVLTPAGTLVMPAHSSDYSDPAQWQNPPVPLEWLPIIYEQMPAFDPRYTPTRGMGAIAELFRSWPGTRRSAHPALSFAAWGANADRIVADHAIDFSLGERSPLARIYELDGWVLLLGVGYDRNTSFHLAEYRAPGATQIEQGAPIIEDGRRVWKVYRDIDLDVSPFKEIGAAFEQAGHVRIGGVGSADARFFSQRRAVDFAVQWLTRQRTAGRASERT
jgi:aminoglycoside 3-N-acetyltransferase